MRLVTDSINMNRSPALDATHHFLQVVWKAAPHANGHLADDAAIAEALAKLTSAYYQTPDRATGNVDWLPPQEDMATLKQRAALNFPDYGAYVLADPLGPTSQTPMLADALDDLVSISGELREVALRGKLFGVADAEWFFRLLYFSWGNRVRQLSLYVHARQFG
jgi:hypothetical protein